MVIFAIIFIIKIILIINVIAMLIITRSRLAIVSQEPVLFNKSIADNIRLAMDSIAVSLFGNIEMRNWPPKRASDNKIQIDILMLIQYEVLREKNMVQLP